MRRRRPAFGESHPSSEKTMNTKTLLAVGALAVVATSAHAQDDRWRQILKNDDVTWYADITRRSTETVTTINASAGAVEKVNTAVVWVKQVYAKTQTAQGKEYDALVMQYFVDCKKHRWAQGQWVARSSEGAVVGSGDDSRIAVRFEEVVPETVGEAAMDAICKL